MSEISTIAQITILVLAVVVALAFVYVWRTFPILMTLHKGHLHNVKLTEHALGQVDELTARIENLENKGTAASRRATSKRKVTTA